MLFLNLEQRGLVKQITNKDKIASLLNEGKATFYIGFDPTGDSLHVGHLLQLVTAQRLIKAGNKCIILIGGATATIGDPTGKTEIRKVLSRETVKANEAAFLNQFQTLLNGEFETYNNLNSFKDYSYLNFLQEVGSFFSVNNMLRAECFKARLPNGLSFLEFNYMVLQAWDFYCLHKSHNCVLQIGGDDQWSNMLAGIDLIHKKDKAESFAMTLPLLVTSAGQKMGKTEKGAIFLDEKKTSVFDFYQYFRNIDDADIAPCLKMLTFLSLEEIEEVLQGNINEAKKRLAFEVSVIVHGTAKAKEVEEQSISIFEKKDVGSMPSIQIEGELSLASIVVKTGFVSSRNEAFRLISQGGIYTNGTKAHECLLNKDSFPEGFCILQKGKKNFCRVVFS